MAAKQRGNIAAFHDAVLEGAHLKGAAAVNVDCHLELLKPFLSCQNLFALESFCSLYSDKLYFVHGEPVLPADFLLQLQGGGIVRQSVENNFIGIWDGN